MNRYQEIEIDGKMYLICEMIERIREGEALLGSEQRELDGMTNKELAGYFTELVQEWKDKDSNSSTNYSSSSTDSSSSSSSTDYRSSRTDSAAYRKTDYSDSSSGLGNSNGNPKPAVNKSKDTKEKAASADEAQQQDQTDSNKLVSEKEQNSNAETAILPIRCLRCQDYTEHSEVKYDEEDWRLFVCDKCGSKSYVPKKESRR